MFPVGGGFTVGFAFDQLLDALLVAVMKFLRAERVHEGLGELLAKGDFLLLQVLESSLLVVF